MRLAAWLTQAANELLDLLLPPACPLCFDLLPPGPATVFCPACRAEIPPLSTPCCSRCALPFVTAGGQNHLCAECLGEQDPPFSRVQAAGLYDGLLRRAVQRFKYSDAIGLDHPLGALLAARLDPGPAQLLVPVPLHPSRLRQRCYNQSLLLARCLGRQFGLPVAAGLLRRTRATPSQQGLPAVVRRRNLKGAFALGEAPGPCHILLVDDVMTTGSTARECARTLRAGGALRVEVAVVARAGNLLAPCPPGGIC
ncbi:ComF family protein [Desulfuromonas carbonis]